MQNKWIQKAEIKKGALHSQLGIPKDKKIPVTLLNKIIKSSSGKAIVNPTKTGRRMIYVTRKLERRAIFAKNMRSR